MTPPAPPATTRLPGRRAAALAARMALCSLLALAAAAAPAATVPWGTKAIDRLYEQKDLRDLLRELAAAQNIVANIDAGVPAVTVNGRFNMSAGQLFQYLSSTHGLVHYYAGNVLYVFPASASVTEVVPVRPEEITRVMRALHDFKLIDPQYPIKVNRREGVLLVSGPRGYVDMVRRMVRTTPVAESSPVEVRVFPLKYASAADQVLRRGGRDLVTPGVVSVLRQVFARSPAAPERRESSKLREAFARTQEPATARVANTDLELRLPPRMPTPQEIAGTDAAAPEQAPAERGDTGSLPHIVADSRLNAVVVRDIASRMPDLETLVRTLDVRQAAVEIEVSVIEVSSNDLSALGMDWRFHSSRVDLRSGRRDLPDERFPSSLPPSSGTPYDPGPVLSAAAAMGGVLTTVLTDGGRQFLSRINALSTDGKASFRAAPKVLTLNNAEAVLERLRTFFVRVPGTYQSQLYDVSVGTSMSVVPTLVDEGGETQIRLAVKIDDGEVTAQSVDGIPVITRNAIGTQAYVALGQSLLIAGYKEDATGSTESGVPGLSKVPVVGWLFKQRESTGGTLERLYMITPRVLQSDAAEPAAPQQLGGAPSRAPTRVSLAERSYGYKVPRDLEPELVVLTGVHDGARVPLQAAACVLGSADGCDVMLGDAGVRPIHASLSVVRDRLVLRLAGATGPQEPAPGAAHHEERQLETYEPFRIGEAWLAVVPGGFEWGHVVPWPEDMPTDDGGDQVDAPGAVPGRWRLLVDRAWPFGLAVAALLTIGVGLVAGEARSMRGSAPRESTQAVWTLPLSSPSPRQRVQALNRVIEELGLHAVSIDAAAEPQVLTGFVADREELQALSLAVARRSLGRTEVRVQVGTELAKRAQEFLADPGVRAEYVAPGKLVLSGRAQTKKAVALNRRVQQLAEDLGGVSIDDRIDFGELAAEAPPPKEVPLPLKIVEVQADEPAFFRTADGSKFFVGARMPDGAEVIAVGADEILFRKNGRPLAYRVLE